MNNPFDKAKTPLSWEIWEKNNDPNNTDYAFYRVPLNVRQKKITQRDMDILAMRKEGFGLDNIGLLFGLSKARVSQIVRSWKETPTEV